MLHTYLTTNWQLRYPVIGAPMAYVAGGRLARAVSQAGGLGMIGIGSKESLDFVARETAVARGDDQGRFGIGLMAWALEARPELLQAAIEARPFLISISFGSPAPYVDIVHQHGIRLATQVHSRAEALHAAQSGVDLIVAQGSEAGGHTGQISSLPLLQSVLDAVQVPVVVAGGIATPRGVAAALAAGASGVWVGTCLLASPECSHVGSARERILQAQDTETISNGTCAIEKPSTILTRVFDTALGIAWPTQFPGRALRNHFAEQWHTRTDELVHNEQARQELAEAIKRKDYDVAYIYAGEAVSLVTQQQAAGDIIRQLGDGAEQLLSERYRALFQGTGAIDQRASS